MRKRIRPLLVCLMLSVGLAVVLPIGVFAAAVPASTAADYEYAWADGGVLITKYTGSSANVVIPTTLDGQTVVGIGSSAFKENTTLTSVTVPEGITSIGYNAFELCTSLKTVDLPESLAIIESDAFKDCSGLTDITIPENVSRIGARVFWYCQSLERINIPEHMTSVSRPIL